MGEVDTSFCCNLCHVSHPSVPPHASLQVFEALLEEVDMTLRAKFAAIVPEVLQVRLRRSLTLLPLRLCAYNATLRCLP